MSYRIEDIPLAEFDLSLSEMRVMNMVRVLHIEKSMRLHGQLQMVIARVHEGGFQLIDGFKRLYAAEDLMMETLQCRLLDIDLSQAKILLLSYNHSNQSMEVWEEAVVLKDLQTNHDLDQGRLASLTGYSRSWVSRRLGLIQKLDEAVCDEIRMGTLTSSHARALIRLPRGKQRKLARVITTYGLSSRLSNTLVDAFLKADNELQQNYILAHPEKVLNKEPEALEDTYDPRLSGYGNDLAKSIAYVVRSVQTLLSRLSDQHLGELSQVEKMIISPGFEKTLFYLARLTEAAAELQTTKTNTTIR